ncbi:SU10 major capsid protein [Variovorax sp. ZT5P49]|uniref:SU10 major capsid protein n=1 Tax=Variovorax sp. ZT5P49 TaxID=3443733 RepID=UPI003F461B5D
MAQPTNLYDRYDAGTNVREDLIDKITMTNPEETPVISSFGRAAAENTLHEWQRDNLRAPNKDNAAIDGDDATASNKTPPVRVGNICQIFQDTIAVSGRVERVKKAGMKSALAYYKAKAYKELQRDMEAMTLSANPAVAGSGAAAAKSGGLGVLLYTNAQHGAGGSTVAHTSGAPTTAPTAGTPRAFTEALLKAAVQAAYTSSGKIPPAAYMGPNHKSVFSAFTGIALNRVEIKEKKQARIIGGADVYTSDFGDIEIVPHYIMAGSTNVYGLNPEYGDAVYLRPFQSEPLGKSGDSTKEQVLVDATVRVTSENVHWKIADLSGG